MLLFAIKGVWCTSHLMSHSGLPQFLFHRFQRSRPSAIAEQLVEHLDGCFAALAGVLEMPLAKHVPPVGRLDVGAFVFGQLALRTIHH